MRFIKFLASLFVVLSAFAGLFLILSAHSNPDQAGGLFAGGLVFLGITVPVVEWLTKDV